MDKKAKLAQGGCIKVIHVGSGNLILLGLSMRYTIVRLVDQRYSGTPCLSLMIVPRDFNSECKSTFLHVPERLIGLLLTPLKY